MSDSQFLVASSLAIGEPLTVYVPVAGNLISNATEANTEIPIRDAGVFSNLFVYVSANAISSSVITFRKNRAATGLTVTYDSSETGIKEDTTNTVTVTATDEIDYEVVTEPTTGTQTITIKVMGLKFAPTITTDCVSKMAVVSASIIAGSVTYYFMPYGNAAETSDESRVKYRIRDTFTASDLYVYVSANARTTDTVFRTRKNGANGGQSVTYASGETGAKEDTTGTDSLIAGNDFNFSFTTSTGTQSLTLQVMSCSLINTGNKFVLLNGTGAVVSFNTTTYCACAGRMTFNTAEINSQIYPRFTFTAKELGVYVFANTITTSATTITVRDNGSDSLMTVSYAAAETGLKLDSTNTAEITLATDEIDYKVVTPNTSGSITIMWIGMMGESAGAGPQIISGVGGIISAESLGTTIFNLNLLANSIPSAELLGSSKINLSVSLSGIASSEIIGTSKINLSIALASISSEETIGKANFIHLLTLGGISSAEAIGGLTISIGGLIISGVGNIQSEETLGTLKFDHRITTAGIPSEETLGTLLISIGGQFITGVGGIVSEETIGVSKFNLGIHLSGIASEEKVGTLFLSGILLVIVDPQLLLTVTTGKLSSMEMKSGKLDDVSLGS